MLFQDLINTVISALFGALAAVLVARYSKTKEERETGLAQDYLKIADMSGAQLEKKINQVTILINQVATLEARLADIENQRDRRGEEITELNHKIENLNREYAAQVAELNARIEKEEGKNRLYKTIIEKLIELLEKADPKLLDGVDLPETLRKIRAVRK